MSESDLVYENELLAARAERYAQALHAAHAWSSTAWDALPALSRTLFRDCGRALAALTREDVEAEVMGEIRTKKIALLDTARERAEEKEATK